MALQIFKQNAELLIKKLDIEKGLLFIQNQHKATMIVLDNNNKIKKLV